MSTFAHNDKILKGESVMKKIKKVVAILSIVSLLIATAFSASAVEANASYDPVTNHATVLHNENQVIPVAGTTQLSQDEYKRTWGKSD